MVIDFAYGLTFFVMGIGTALAARTFRASQLALARALPLLASFGILVGLAVWGVVFIPLQAAYMPAPWLDGLRLLQSLVLLAGHACLLAFGLRLTANWQPLRLAAAAALGLGAGSFLLSVWMSPVDHRGWWETMAHHLAAYGLGLPGAALSAWGLLLQRRELAPFYHRPARSLLLAAWAFILSVPLGPLAIPTAGRSAATLFGVPLEAPLAIGGFVLAWSLFAGLEALRLENARRLERAEWREALLEGRYRLAKELNDGVIQDLFAVGMMMGAAQFDAPPDSRTALAAAERQLQGAVERMRSYVMDLDPVDWTEPDLAAGLRRLVDEFRANSLIPASLEAGQVGKATARAAREVYGLAYEALSNVRRHSGASEVRVAIRREGDALLLAICDNGCGLDPAAAGGSGLERMHRHARALDGALAVKSRKGGGTEITLQLPIESIVT